MQKQSLTYLKKDTIWWWGSSMDWKLLVATQFTHGHHQSAPTGNHLICSKNEAAFDSDTGTGVWKFISMRCCKRRRNQGMETKQLPKNEANGKLGKKWWQHFYKWHKEVLSIKKQYGAWLQTQMVEKWIAMILPKPAFFNQEGKPVQDEHLAFGCKMQYQLTWPEL